MEILYIFTVSQILNSLLNLYPMVIYPNKESNKWQNLKIHYASYKYHKVVLR